MNSDLVVHLPSWQALDAALDRNVSLLIHGARHYGKTALLQAVSHHYLSPQPSRFVFLDLASFFSGGHLDYQRLCDAIRRQAKVSATSRCPDRITFEVALRNLAARAAIRIVLLVRLAGRGHEEEETDFLSAVHARLAADYLENSQRLSLVAVDDFTLWNHERFAGIASEMFCLERYYVQPLTAAEVATALDALSRQRGEPLPAEQRNGWAERAIVLTGGHVGLLMEIFQQLSELNWQVTEDSWPGIAGRLGRSPILAAIQLALQEEPAGMAQTALEYREPKFPMELRSSRVLLLRRLGVLHEERLHNLVLCPGVIREMIESIGTNRQPGRLGLVVDALGGATFEAGRLEPEDSDVVVVHLSDLHIGKEHGFSYKDHHGHVFYGDRRSLADALFDDLESLGLIGRLDGLIVSGDFVWSGTAEEFRPARQVLDHLCQRLLLPPERLVILPGNHDVSWRRVDGAGGPASDEVKRDSFDDFAEHFDHSFASGACAKTLTSPDGRRRIVTVSLDSNWVENESAAGIGYVAPQALADADRLLNGLTAPPAEGVTSHVWLVVHHHIFPATPIRLIDAQARRITIMANAPEILSRAQQWRAELILHGHEHQPSVTVARRWPTDAMGKHFVPVTVVGAGSAGAEKNYLGPFGRNQYFVIYRRAHDTILRSRVMGDEGFYFTAHNDIVIRDR